MTTRRTFLTLALGAAGIASQVRPARAAQPGGDEIRVAFVGDSMADGLWGGLTRHVTRNRCLQGRVVIGRYGRNGTGLTRLDQFSWPSEMRTIVAEFRPHLVVVSLGLNDRQSIVTERNERTAWGSPRWDERYREQVAAMVRAATSGSAQLVWLGLPAMRDAAVHRDAQEKNRLFEDAIATFADPGIVYHGPWRLKPDGEDTFQSFAQNAQGSMVQIRATDGVHFTGVGYDMIFAHLLPRMREVLTHGGIDLPAACP